VRGILTIIPASGAVSSQELAAPPRLQELKAGIGGGYIERVPGFTHYQGEPCVAFCDEDGKRKQMPVNSRATALWYKLVGGPVFDTYDGPQDRLVGSVVIVTGEEVLRAMQSDDDDEEEE
jgi:hypothetical protein